MSVIASPSGDVISNRMMIRSGTHDLGDRRCERAAGACPRALAREVTDVKTDDILFVADHEPTHTIQYHRHPRQFATL
jgi:hypothetical protein